MASETLENIQTVEKEQVEIESDTKEIPEEKQDKSEDDQTPQKEEEKSEEDEEDTPEKEEEEKIPAKGIRKRDSKKDGGEGSTTTKRQKKASAAEAATPNSRPSRERKAVQRFSANQQQLPVKKELTILQGQGTALKDIPNVAFKLSKRKADENLQMLHAILFGKKTKAIRVKRNIHQFSGFVWVEDEEKQRAKLKEKLDKCVKEKLMDFCDVLDVPVKVTSKKEDVVATLLEFLESPHATTDVSLADKLQSQKNKKLKKRKKASTTVSNSKDTSSSAKKQRKSAETKKKENNLSEALDEAEDEVEDEVEDEEAESDKDDDVVTPPKEENNEEFSEEKEEEDEEEEKVEEKKKRSSKKASSEAKSKVEKGTPKKKTESEKSPTKSVKTPEKSKKSSEKRTSKKASTETDDKVSDTPKSKGSTRGKKEKGQKSETTSVASESKTASKKTKSKASDKGKTGGAKSDMPAAEPSREEMQATVSKILKEVDFNTATLSDILRKLEAQYGMTLIHRKAEVKGIIEEVISNMTDEEDDGSDGEAVNGSDAE